MFILVLCERILALRRAAQQSEANSKRPEFTSVIKSEKRKNDPESAAFKPSY
jgi:hypothetical protein